MRRGFGTGFHPLDAKLGLSTKHHQYDIQEAQTPDSTTVVASDSTFADASAEAGASLPEQHPSVIALLEQRNYARDIDVSATGHQQLRRSTPGFRAGSVPAAHRTQLRFSTRGRRRHEVERELGKPWQRLYRPTGAETDGVDAF